MRTPSNKPEVEPKRRGRPPGKGIHGRPTYNQAAKVVARFGGAGNLAQLLGVSRSTVYRWGYAAPYGCDGLVPAHVVGDIHKAARLDGVILTPRDWAPERISYPESAPELDGILK